MKAVCILLLILFVALFVIHYKIAGKWKMSKYVVIGFLALLALILGLILANTEVFWRTHISNQILAFLLPVWGVYVILFAFRYIFTDKDQQNDS